MKKMGLKLTSPVHGLYKVDYIKSFADTVSRHFATSTLDIPRMLPPPCVKVYVRPIRCMSKHMNIEGVEIMRVRKMLISK